MVRPRRSLTEALSNAIDSADHAENLETAKQSYMTVPWTQVHPNPRNPRRHLRRPPEDVTWSDWVTGLDFSDMESLKTAEIGQLQPVVVVTRGAFLGIYPDLELEIGDALWVAVAGSRRRLAVEQFGLATLEIRVVDALAQDRGDFFGAAVLENVEREQFAPLEEAEAIAEAVELYGSQKVTALRFGKSPGWVHQRLSLRELAPSLKDEMRVGRLKIDAARQLLRLKDHDEQIAAWHRLQAGEPGGTEPDTGGGGEDSAAGGVIDLTEQRRPAGKGRPVTRVSFKIDDEPASIAQMLMERLDAETVRAVLELLQAKQV